MPAALPILEHLGVLPQLQQAGAQPFSGIHFYPTGGETLALDFNRVSPTTRGMILSRTRLDSLLAKHAGNQPGVYLREAFIVRAAAIRSDRVEIKGHGVNGTHRYSARLLIAADGIQSRFQRQFEIHRRRPRFRRFALRTYYPRLCECRSIVEVHFSSIGEAYVAPLGKSRALITLLLFMPPLLQTRKLSDLYFESLKHFPQLEPRLVDPYPSEPVKASGPLASSVSRCHGHRLLLVGDAGGAVDPVTGQGMTLALKDAQLACEVLERRLAADRLSEEELRVYTERRSGYFAPSYELAEFLLLTFRHPFLARRVLRSLSSKGALARKALELATDLPSPASLDWRDRLRMVLGI